MMYVYAAVYLVIGFIFGIVMLLAGRRIDRSVEEDEKFEISDWLVLLFPELMLYAEFFLDYQKEKEKKPLSHSTLFWGRSKLREALGVIFFTVIWPLKIISFILGWLIILSFCLMSVCSFRKAKTRTQ